MEVITQKIPTGYKQTDIGVIPADWKYLPFGHIAKELKGGAAFTPNDFVKVGMKVIPKSGIVRGGILKIKSTNEQYCTEDFASKNTSSVVNKSYTMIVLRDLVPTGPNIGLMVRMVDNGLFILAQGVYAFKVHESDTDANFLIHLSNSSQYRRLMKSILVGSTQVHIRTTTLKDTKLPLPPKLEQVAIATALSDVDALIEKLEKLIEKKKNIKQGAMQELLSGKRRLPGFSGKWETKKLGDIAEMSSGGTPSSSNPLYYGGKIPWVVIADMTRISKYLFDTEKNITNHGLENSSAKIFPSGTLLFAMYASIGKCAITKVDVTCNQAILGINTKKIDTEFLYYYLSFNEQKFLQMAQSGTQNNLNKEIVENLKIPYPQTPEQVAIATVLSDMDTEIEKLKSQLTKYQNLKQGMMQTLLTGKIRLFSK